MLKTKISHYFTFKNAPCYIDVLQKLVDMRHTTARSACCRTKWTRTTKISYESGSTRRNARDEGGGISSWATMSARLRRDARPSRKATCWMYSQAVRHTWTLANHDADLQTERWNGRAYKRQVLHAGAAERFSTRPLSDWEDHPLATRMQWKCQTLRLLVGLSEKIWQLDRRDWRHTSRRRHHASVGAGF